MKKLTSKPVVGIFDFCGRYIAGAGFILTIALAANNLYAGEILQAKVMGATSLMYLGPAIAYWFGYPVHD